MQLIGQNIVGGQYQFTSNTKSFKTFNPELNKETAHLFYQATEEEVNRAVEMAWDAFFVYRNTSGKQRATLLNTIANEIENLGEDLMDLYCEESGLPRGRALGERARTLFQLRKFAQQVENDLGIMPTLDFEGAQNNPTPKPDLRKMHIPLGPVAVFGSSNFPLAYSTAGGDTASALAAGCPVIVKAHPMHAGVGELVASAITRAIALCKLPSGIFSNLNAIDYEVGQQLIGHPQIKAVGFTGSIAGGKALMEIARKRSEPIPVFAEMGSVNPIICLENNNENISKWSEILVQSIALGAGQFCTSPGLVFGLKGNAFDHLIEGCVQNLKGILPQTMLHPKLFNNYKNQTKAVLNIPEVTTLTQALEENRLKIIPVLAKTEGSNFLKHPSLHEEVFGSFALFIECDSLEELNECIHRLPGQLTGSIWCDNKELINYNHIIQNLTDKVGRLIFNGVPTGVEVCDAMQHGGPFPASSDSRFGAVGSDAINRWLRPVCYQNWPEELLPDPLKIENPLNLIRRINGKVLLP